MVETTMKNAFLRYLELKLQSSIFAYTYGIVSSYICWIYFTNTWFELCISIFLIHRNHFLQKYFFPYDHLILNLNHVKLSVSPYVFAYLSFCLGQENSSTANPNDLAGSKSSGWKNPSALPIFFPPLPHPLFCGHVLPERFWQIWLVTVW